MALGHGPHRNLLLRHDLKPTIFLSGPPTKAISTYWYILKQRVALKARSNWLAKLRISFAIYLRATREKMASRLASVTSEEIIQINFCGVYYLIVLVYTKTTIHLSAIGLEVDIYRLSREAPSLR